MHRHRHFARDIHSIDLLETLLVTAVVCVLLVRTLLAATGYPQLGSKHHLHVAHVLWGGFLMVFGVVILLRYWNPSARRIAAFAAGAGFGLFIDEVGKFLTQDNDYFYEPAIAMIYVVFVLMFLLVASMERHTGFSEDEVTISDAIDKLDTLERSRIPTWYHRLVGLIEKTYGWTVQQVWFISFLVVSFVALACFEIIAASGLLFYHPRALNVYAIQAIVASGSVVFILIGLRSLKKGRARAYVWFRRAVLVNIFVTQPFLFYSWQLGAIGGLAVNLLFYGSLRYAMRVDHRFVAG